MKRQGLTTKAQETKKAILTATTQIILKEGIERVTTNSIAERAGVSIGSLYQYYENKEDIYEELFFALIRRREERIKEALGFHTLTLPPEKTIASVVEAVVDAGSSEDLILEQYMFSLLMRTKNEKAIIEHAASFDGMVRQILKGLLTVKIPSLLKRDLDTVLFILIQAVRGIVMGTSLPQGKKIKKEQLKIELTSLLINYLRAPVPRKQTPAD